MHDAACVRLVHGAAGLQHVAHSLADRHLPALGQLLGEILPVEVFHDHERHAGGQHVHVGDPRHIAAPQLDGGARLTLESADDLRVGEHARVQHLDREALVEPLVPRLEHHAHAALAEHALDPILAGDDLARLGQRWGS